MNTKHKYYDVIVAFAEGKTIQYRRGGNDTLWRDWLAPYCPAFSTHNGAPSYRVKPETRKIRVALFKLPDRVSLSAAESTNYKVFEAANGFTRWVTDEIEVEV